MSIFGSMSVGISGLQAQSTALSNISDNIANAQTTGFKRIDTSFESLVISASNTQYQAGGVQASPNYINSVSGTISTSDTPTNIAIRGNGFFSVSKLTTVNGTTTASTERYYTRDGSFSLNSTRTLVNNSGFALNGFAYDSTTGLYATSATPVQVQSDIDSPVPTKQIDLKANLPTDPSGGITPTQIQVYDSAGTAHNLNLSWRQGNTEGTWQLGVTADGSQGSQPIQSLLSTGFPAAITESSLLTGRNDRAQVDDVTFATSAVAPAVGFNIGDTYSVVVNGTTYSQSITQANAAQFSGMKDIAQALADKINGADTSSGVLATVTTTGNLRLTAKTAGTPFTLDQSVTAGAITTHTATDTLVQSATATTPEIRTSTFVGNSINIDDVYSMTVNGNTYSVTVTPANINSLSNINGVVQKLAAQIGAGDPTVTATPSNGTITVKSTTNGTPITVVSSATDSPGLTNTATQSTYTGNITGSKEVEKISLTGQPGDVGTTYSITIQSPQAKTVTPVETLNAGAPTDYTYDFATPYGGTAPAVGQLYTISLGSSTYNIQMTNSNIANYPDVASVVTDLAAKVQADTNSPFTVVSSAGGVLQLATKANDAQLSTTQVVPQSFSQAISYTTDGTETSLSDISGKLAAKVNAISGIPVQATSSGGTITLTGNTDASAFYTSIPGGSTASTPGVVVGKTPGHISLTFGGTLSDGTTAAAGTLSHMDTASIGTGNATVSADQSANSSAQVGFDFDFGYGLQHIVLNLGNFGESSGLTQFDGTNINVTSKVQDGSPAGTFKDVQINADGTVLANYDNGRQRTIAKVPIVLFNNPDALSRSTGNVFTETVDSGKARFNDTGVNGAGDIASSSLEGSNVDIASEFTQLIVAQRSYTANTKVITTADDLLQDTINLKR
ncbi:flagellar hook-basal body complex protein [Nitrospirillum amazonense]|uniref:Flagellar hook protein FlgE n=1 Tax=Nitrospirillum amazonense TaxID=28077 RepID=A0A560K251_9PROT|nr:flagellar hook-basal body complex protein [Nitrospirillum amazonense]MDG3443865.1 flagellar hook-basal body complex protein [Nitrospirillum amazonense]TWB77425.1 flagellar hook protein FlgE [Nitrospirillum amazonense]